MTVKEMIQAYYPGVWTKEQVDELLKNNKISVADYLSLFPITEDNPVTDELIALFRVSKLAELRAICNSMIEQGVDVATSNSGDTIEHFSLDSYSQNNITNMFYSVMAGIEEYPYHADGKECTTYSKEDIVAIYVSAQSAITYHTTYNNMLRALVNRIDDVETLAAVTYGMELPEDLNTSMQSNIAAAQAQIQKILATLSGTVVLD
ncbi:hypothetical protein AALD01_07905 [Oscillospiraceae bacterium 21-37]